MACDDDRFEAKRMRRRTRQKRIGSQDQVRHKRNFDKSRERMAIDSDEARSFRRWNQIEVRVETSKRAARGKNWNPLSSIAPRMRRKRGGGLSDLAFRIREMSPPSIGRDYTTFLTERNLHNGSCKKRCDPRKTVSGGAGEATGLRAMRNARPIPAPRPIRAPPVFAFAAPTLY